jgi:hypothetical protein
MFFKGDYLKVYKSILNLYPKIWYGFVVAPKKNVFSKLLIKSYIKISKKQRFCKHKSAPKIITLIYIYIKRLNSNREKNHFIIISKTGFILSI